MILVLPLLVNQLNYPALLFPAVDVGSDAVMTRVARCSCFVEQALGQSSVIDSLRMPKAKSCAMGHPQQPAGSAIGWHARVLT